MGNCLNVPTSSAPLLLLVPPSSADDDPTSESEPPAIHNMKRRRLWSIFSAPILPPCTPSNLRALFELGPEIGRGQSGIIRLCTERASRREFACKSIPKLRLCTQNEVEDVIAEIETMRALSGHPNIVQLHLVVEDRAYVHLVMELCRGGELFDRLACKGRYSEPEAASLMRSLMETVLFCHGKGIVHRDLKPENILLVDVSDTSTIKLADFGLARRFSPGQKFTGMAGSAYYIAPEVLQGDQRYGVEVDVWSGGVILYVLLSGVPPFWGETEEGIFKSIREGKLDLTSDPWNKISASAKDVIAKMLCLDTKSRLTPAEVLGHPWILEHSANAMSIGTGAPLHSCQDVQTSSLPHNIHRADLWKGSDMSFNRSSSDMEASSIPSFPPQSILTSLTESRDSALGCLHNITQKLNIDELLRSLIGKLENKLLSLSPNLIATELPEGWCYSCTFLKNTTSEQTLVVQLGQQRYLIVHDRLRKRIGWKVLDEEAPCIGKHCQVKEASTERPSTPSSKSINFLT